MSFHDNPAQFYANSRQFFQDLMGAHLRLRHLPTRTAVLVALARRVDARSFADWGAGVGRDCIAMARSGLLVTHVDVLGEGTVLAGWRYSQRGLAVAIADALNPTGDRFDIISNFDCMEHLEDPIAVLGQIVSRLNPAGLLVLAVDFYNFDLAQPGPHLPKNFVYGGLMQMALDTIGMRKIAGRPSPWFETAGAETTVWQKPADLELSEAVLTRRLREQTLKFLYTFREFYDEEIARTKNQLRTE
ncbi:MAG: class I SAM-dependent methyltransferase [Candidatus Methylomirabilia bacterium]